MAAESNKAMGSETIKYTRLAVMAMTEAENTWQVRDEVEPP